MGTTQESSSLLALNAEEVDLGVITERIKQRDQFDEKIADLEKQLEGLKARRDDISRVQIPNLMDEFGLEELKLIDGRKIKIKHVIKASIKQENRDTAYSWLKAQGHADIIKSEVSFKTTKGREEDAIAVLEAIQALGYSANKTDTVHWATLNAWAREQYERGMEFPDFIGIFDYRETEVK